MTVKLHFAYGHPPEGTDAVWRCEAKRYAYVSDYDRDDWSITAPRLELRWHHVDRRTPKGAWLYGGFHLLSAKRGLYRNTPEEAVAHFIKRRERQIEILKGQLQRAEYELRLATTGGLIL